MLFYAKSLNALEKERKIIYNIYVKIRNVKTIDQQLKTFERF